MQDEINNKVVALSVSTGKIGARMTYAMLKAAMRKFLRTQKQLMRRQKPDHSYSEIQMGIFSSVNGLMA